MAVAIEYGSQGSAASSSGVATIAGLDFNAEASDRIIAADIAFENTADVVSITGVTIGGVTAALGRAANLSGRNSAIWTASVPSGTSGDVVITFSGGDTTVSADTHSVTGAETTLTDDDAATGTGADIAITALTIPTDGAGLATTCNQAGSGAIAWTGATISHTTDAGNFQHSSAIITAAGTNTVTADGPSGTQSLVGVAFGPASGGATAYTADLTAGSFALTGTSITVPTGRLVDLSPGAIALTGTSITVPTGRNASLTPGSFAVTGSDIDGVYVDNGAPIAYAADLDPGVFVLTGSLLETATTAVTTQPGPADDRPARRKRRDRETLEAYYAALQRKANEDAEREKLEALAEAERALEEAESAKKAEAKRAAVRKVFAALDRAALTEKAKAGAREAEQAALQAIAKRQTQEQREAYLDALDQLNVEIEMIGAQIARLYARRREEEQFLLQRWFAA